jgi:hypothetical protein
MRLLRHSCEDILKTDDSFSSVATFPPPRSAENQPRLPLFVVGCTYVKTLCRPLCNRFDARAVRGGFPRFSSSHKFNLFGGPAVRHGPMSCVTVDCRELAKLPDLLRKD